MTDLVSIVTPLFNRARLVVETIDSVVSQTNPNWELLIVDDHSDDRGLAIAEAKAAIDSRIKAWRRRSDVKGAPSCRNEGLAKAAGNYVIFLDSDDLLAPSCIENRLKACVLDPRLDYQLFPSEQFRYEPGDLGLLWFRHAEDDLAGFLEKPLWQTTAAIWKIDSIRNLGGFREDLLAWQDWELFVRAMINDANYKIHDTQADNFIRRSLHDRISFHAERDQAKLENRKCLFRDTFRSLNEAGKLNPTIELNLINLFVGLATKLRIVGQHRSADGWISEIADMGLISRDQVDQTIELTVKNSRLTFRQRVAELKLWVLSIYYRMTG